MKTRIIVDSTADLVPEIKARVYTVPLTVHFGQEDGKRIAEKISAVLDTVSRTLTEDERATFYRSLSAISISLEAIAQNSEE